MRRKLVEMWHDDFDSDDDDDDDDDDVDDDELNESRPRKQK